jgi:4-coumarate--CoA ligase
MKIKGCRVNPVELEGHFLEHPDVLNCCVVPIPDGLSGQIPKAFIVLTMEAQNRLDPIDPREVDKLKAVIIQVYDAHLLPT